MIDLSEKYKVIETHYKEIEDKLSSPDAVKDLKLYADLSRTHRELSQVVAAFRRKAAIESKLKQAEEMMRDADADMAAMAAEEAAASRLELEDADQKLQVLLLPVDPRDAKNTIVEIRAGTGGDEAGLFARDLFVMYNRFAERLNWKVELINSSENDHGGFKEVIFLVTGERVYSQLKYEAGTHRVQRVPATENQGRIHTSAVTVAVMPEAEEVDIVIRQEDLKIDVFRSSGPGGQSVNTTDSAVRVTHVPTGIVVSQQDEKSQIKNKAKALKVLRSRLYDMEQEKIQSERAAERKQMVGTGDRSGRIRTYNFPQNRLTDHRINLTLYSLDGIMQGNLEPVIDPLISFHQAEALKSI